MTRLGRPAPAGPWRAAAWIGITLLLFDAAAPAAELVRETFEAATWSLPAAWRVAGGELLATAAGSSPRLLVPGTQKLSEGSVSITLRQAEGAVNGLRGGLLFQAADTDNAYFVLLRGDGAYWLGKLVGGKVIPALTGYLAAVTTAGPNTVKVSFEGARQTVLVNGTRLVSRQDGTYTGGAVGLWAEGTGTLAFDDLQVTDLRAAAAAAGTPSGTPVVTPAEPAESSAPVPPVRDGEPPAPATPTLVERPTPTPEPPTPVAPPTPTPVTPTTPGPRPAEAPPNPTPVEPAVPTGPATEPTPGPTPVAPTAPQPPATDAAKVLFHETFDPPKYRWNEDGLRSIEGGEIRIRAVDGYLLSGFPLSFGDFTYRARCRPLSDGGGTYGLVARLQRDGQSGYLFVLRDPDLFAVARLENGRSTLLRRGEVVLPPGWRAVDVECVGSTFTFRVNGAVVATFSDEKYALGGVGLWVDNHRQAAFDDLVVEEVRSLSHGDAGLVSILQPQPEARRTLLEERFDPPRLDWQQDDQRRIEDGALVLSSEPDRYVMSGAPEKRTGDWSASVELARLSGPDAGLCGFVARLQPDGRSGYLGALTGSSRFVVVRLADDGALELSRVTVPVRPGPNTITAHCDGDRIEFELNGTTVATFRDTLFRDGGFGLYVDHGVTARFDNLVAVARRAMP